MLRLVDYGELWVTDRLARSPINVRRCRSLQIVNLGLADGWIGRRHGYWDERNRAALHHGELWVVVEERRGSSLLSFEHLLLESLTGQLGLSLLHVHHYHYTQG